MFTLFIIVPPGFESVLQGELANLRISVLSEEVGGVSCQVNLNNLVKLHLCLGSPSQILLRLGEFLAPSIPQFVRRIKQIDWKQYLTKNSPLHIHISTKKSKLYHQRKIKELLLEVLNKQGLNPSQLLSGNEKGEELEYPSQSIHINLDQNMCRLSINSSGRFFYKRGYRIDTGFAPLRENLAFGILRLAGWDGESVFLDPMCGSGTFPIEAAMMAENRPPHFRQNFAFELWPKMNALKDEIKHIKKRFIQPKASLDHNLQIMGSDISAEAIHASYTNTEASQIEVPISYKVESLEKLKVHSVSGLMILNPPYGKRVQGKSPSVKLFKELGLTLKKKFRGWKLVILCPGKDFAKALKMDFTSLALINNGGIRIYIMMSEL